MIRVAVNSVGTCLLGESLCKIFCNDLLERQFRLVCLNDHLDEAKEEKRERRSMPAVYHTLSYSNTRQLYGMHRSKELYYVLILRVSLYSSRGGHILHLSPTQVPSSLAHNILHYIT